MAMDGKTPWHKVSYDRFLLEQLPELIAERMPLGGYRVEPAGSYSCRVTITLSTRQGEVVVDYEDLPQPDETGVFRVGDVHKVVVPVADSQNLEQASIACVGEQLYDYIERRLGHAAPDLPWDAALARAWLPLDSWLAEFLAGSGDPVVAQPTDDANWLAWHTHLRRLLVPRGDDVIAPGQMGRVCPFETPEGPNIGHVLTIAAGAEIRDGRLVVVEDRPEATLGLSASMIPFLEHDDPNRILMGTNMLRQWIAQKQPEPALVQTGNEPDAAGVWVGRNLLTAFVAWGEGTFEDGIVVSASCAHRFDTPYPLRVGDKMSNRHGTAGVVSRVLPDDAMPHLPDGTPVDLVYNFASLHRRMNFGQVREAVLGRVAHVEGQVAVVPPFGGPDETALRARLVGAGLPESGMETLLQGRGGVPLAQPSTVGWVYWGRLFHLAADKLHVYTSGQWGQVQGEMENYILRDMGAFEITRENLNTCSARRPDAGALAARLAAGPIAQAEPPTPLFVDLVRRLRVAGIAATLEDGQLAFGFAPSQPGSLKLARPVPHPWLRERSLTEIAMPEVGPGPDTDEVWNLLFPPGGWTTSQTLAAAYAALAEANERLARMLGGQVPDKLVSGAVAQLEARVRALFDVLLTPAHLRLSGRVAFSARTVLAPAANLHLDQVGMPEAMAWALFAPLVERELGGDAEAVTARSDAAVRALDAVMGRTWVIVNRAPTVSPTALLAFHPVRVPGDALHLPPLLCEWLDADFDGDQAAVFMPVTEAAQREAGEKLSVMGHLRRDPTLLSSLLPRLDALWGLAALSQQPSGLAEIEALAGGPVAAPHGFVTHAALADALCAVLARDSVDAVLPRLEGLMARGFEVAQASGASLAPFPRAGALGASRPTTETTAAWDAYVVELAEALAAPTDCAPAGLGPQCLLARATGRGLEQLAWLIAGRGPVEDVEGRTAIVRHGYADGYTPDEMLSCVAGARRGLAQVIQQWEQLGRSFRERNVSHSLNVLTRALRSQHPGVVFARAAAVGEIDPLADVEARMLVGLPVVEG